jgi:glycerol-3-phosphate dehydrogenase
MWRRLRAHPKPWDIIVVGGGATGVGVAIDAASRGYDTLLLEQSDFGKGTSSRSTKLAHGGVRYLEQGNIGLVMEALKERGLLLQNARENMALVNRACCRARKRFNACPRSKPTACAVAQFITTGNSTTRDC